MRILLQKPNRLRHNVAVNTNSLPAKNFGVGVHDIQRLFKAPILDKANYFTVKGRQVIFVFVQNYDTWDAKPDIKVTKYIQHMVLNEVNIRTHQVLRFGSSSQDYKQVDPRTARDTSLLGRPIPSSKLHTIPS